MKHPYVFTERALQDITFHAIYYETILDQLSERFLNEVTVAAEEISLLPKGYESRFKNTRERKLRNFPHKLIYTFEERIIYIHAVFALKQNPIKKHKNL